MISVIIPTFNEKNNISKILYKLLKIKNISEIIFVDDRSTDGTFKEIKKFFTYKKVRGFVRNSKFRDLSKSVLYGVKKSKNKIILVMDCDLQHNPKYIKKMERKLNYYKCEIVIATRFEKKNISGNLGLLRSLLSNMAIQSINLILGKKGYLESAYVVSYNKELDFNYHSEFSKDFVNGVGFNDGFKYSDYKSGDKVAVAGIGGLVAGSLGVKALAKTGLLVKLAKFWWILLAPLAFLGKFLSGKENSNNSTKDTSTLVRKRKRKK